MVQRIFQQFIAECRGMTTPDLIYAGIFAICAGAFKHFFAGGLSWRDIGSVAIPFVWTLCFLASVLFIKAAIHVRREQLEQWATWKPILHGSERPTQPSVQPTLTAAGAFIGFAVALVGLTFILGRPAARSSSSVDTPLRKPDPLPGVPKDNPQTPRKTEPQSPYADIGLLARSLGVEIKAFMLSRHLPIDINLPDDEQNRKQNEYFKETNTLFASMFDRRLVEVQQRLRGYGLGDFKLDLDIGWLNAPIIVNDIPDRLSLIADRLSFTQGVESLRLPYQRHLLEPDIKAFRDELKGRSGRIAVVALDDDTESQTFAREISIVLRQTPGWQSSTLTMFHIALRLSFTPNSTGIELSGEPRNLAMQAIDHALSAIRLDAQSYGSPHPSLTGLTIPDGTDAVLLVREIPRFK